MRTADAIATLQAELSSALRERDFWRDEIEELQDRIEALRHGQHYQPRDEEEE